MEPMPDYIDSKPLRLNTTRFAETPRKMQRRKKLRRLVEAHKKLATNNGTQRTELRRILKGTILLMAAIAIMLGNYLTQTNANTDNLLRDFRHSYRNHYHQIVHGQADYCAQKLDTAAMSARIRAQHILHQQCALVQLEVALRNDTYLNSIAVVGPTGVGKSLWARAFEEQFPWRENVQTYAWNTFASDDAEKFRMIRLLLERFSDCGHNLLVIENLTPCKSDVVSQINKLITEEQMQLEKSQRHRVIVIYIFNLNTMIKPTLYQKYYEMLQHLPYNTTTVNFKAFGLKELKDCIRREASLEHLTLSVADFDEIVSTIDPTRSGCKNVHAKVLTHGKREFKELIDLN